MKEWLNWILFLLFVAFLILITIRVILVAPAFHTRKEVSRFETIDALKNQGQRIMIFLGSGGHTGEMIHILKASEVRRLEKIWVISSGDSASLIKAKELEKEWRREKDCNEASSYILLHRARRVNETTLLSIRNTIISFLNTICELAKLTHLPKILLLNGPGTSVPLAYVLFIIKFFGMCDTRIIYIESLARVNNLSLSGILLLPICDRFIVQWESLSIKYKRAEYYGVLV